MHPADAIMAYRAIIDSGKEVDDVAASFGVSPAYVRRVLKLAALHPTILKAFQKDEIGMSAEQAFALTDDQDRQLEVFKRTGDNPRSEEHTSELQSLMRITYADYCL